METAARDAGYGGIRFLGAFRSRDFRLLWGGQTVSLIGNGAFFVAIGWRVTQLTGRASALPLVLMLYSIAQLTTLLVGGALADRHERRRLMILSDIVRFAVVGGLALTDLSGSLTLALALAFAVGVGLADGFFQPAFGGIVPLTVEADLLPSANALIGVSRNLTFIVGPAIA
ncbi:MAG TPA: MFS transporter, partial [Gaiellaceae bacterium]